MAAAGARIEGLAEFRKELRLLADPKPWTRELTKVYREVGKKAASHAQGAARGMGHEQGHFADAIRGRGSTAGARVAIAGKPGSQGAFYGAKQFRQFDRWVGTGWDVGGAGGPYAVNASIGSHLPEYMTDVRYGIDSVARRAFPD